MNTRTLTKRPTVQLPTLPRLLLLALFFLAGVLLGQVLSGRVPDTTGDELRRYLEDYVRLGGEGAPTVQTALSALVIYFRYPLFAFLLGFASIGVVLLPCVTAAYGFFLSFSVCCFTAAFGVTGMILEHSFHTNTRMTTWLLGDENLKRLAAAEAAAIAEHYGLKKTADEPQRAETVCYHLLSDVPQGDYRTVLDKLIAADILRGRSGTGEERVLDLTEDSVRLLVLLDRAGAFGS